MKLLLPIALAIYVLAFTSCGVTKSVTTTSKTMDIYGSGVMHKPVIADLDVSNNKVSGSATTTNLSISVSDLKNMAVVNALKNVAADVLIEPRFTIVTEGNERSVAVEGFPAKYQNFRAIKAEDIPLLQAGIIQKAEEHKDSGLPQISKKTGRNALIGVSTAAVLATAGAIYYFFFIIISCKNCL